MLIVQNLLQNVYYVRQNKYLLCIIAIPLILILNDNLEKFLEKFEIIINTVPKLILTEKKLNLTNKEVFILDVASKPGGIDRDFAEKNNINYLWKLGIPAEISPVACAQKIKEMIYKNNITYILQ